MGVAYPNCKITAPISSHFSFTTLRPDLGIRRIFNPVYLSSNGILERGMV